MSVASVSGAQGRKLWREKVEHRKVCVDIEDEADRLGCDIETALRDYIVLVSMPSSKYRNVEFINESLGVECR